MRVFAGPGTFPDPVPRPTAPRPVVELILPGPAPRGEPRPRRPARASGPALRRPACRPCLSGDAGRVRAGRPRRRPGAALSGGHEEAGPVSQEEGHKGKPGDLTPMPSRPLFVRPSGRHAAGELAAHSVDAIET